MEDLNKVASGRVDCSISYVKHSNCAADTIKKKNTDVVGKKTTVKFYPESIEKVHCAEDTRDDRPKDANNRFCPSPGCINKESHNQIVKLINFLSSICAADKEDISNYPEDSSNCEEGGALIYKSLLQEPVLEKMCHSSRKGERRS